LTNVRTALRSILSILLDSVDRNGRLERTMARPNYIPIEILMETHYEKRQD
jgi:hypothetical protein